MANNNAPLLGHDQANHWRNSWTNCLPADLANLFYETTSNGLMRINGFQLQIDDACRAYLEKIYDNRDKMKIEGIRIYMACDHNTFTPLLSIVRRGEKKEDIEYLELEQKDWYEAVNTDNNGGLGLLKITEAIADLFVQKWRELSEQEVIDAFSGLTVPDLLGKGVSANNPIHKMRVNSYFFPEEDALGILKKIKDGANNLWLLLGAGLTVQLTHPFNFRPVLFVSDGSLNDSADENGNGDYYERSRPCPPFCPKT